MLGPVRWLVARSQKNTVSLPSAFAATETHPFKQPGPVPLGQVRKSVTKDEDPLSTALSQRSPWGHPPLLMMESEGSAQEKLMRTGQAGPCGRWTEETSWDVGHGENQPGTRAS